MDPFLEALIAWLAEKGIVPPEVTVDDTNREKSYLYALPDSPDNVFAFKNYYTNISSTVVKEIGVKYIQVLVRNKSNKEAFSAINSLYYFLLQRPEIVDQISDHYWCMFDVRNGPVQLDDDENGRHIWSLSFPVKTNLY